MRWQHINQNCWNRKVAKQLQDDSVKNKQWKQTS